MDFACSPAIVEALKARAAHPIYGYTDDEPENPPGGGKLPQAPL